VAWEGGICALGLFLSVWLDLGLGQEMFREPCKLLWAAPATLPLLLFFFGCLYLPAKPLKRIKAFCEEVVRPLFRPCVWYDLAAISILAGVGEEVLFRGVFQTVLGGWLGPWIGMVAASVLFGLCHLITPTYALVTGVIGFYLGWLWVATGNLGVPIAVHALYDFIALVYLAKEKATPRDAGETPNAEFADSH